MHTRRCARAALLSLLVAACADTGGRPVTPRREGEGPTSSPVTVRVANHNWATIDVFAVVDGRRERLGEVETEATATFTLPAQARVARELRLIAHPVGSPRDYDSGPVLVGGGALELTIENQIGLSKLTVVGG